MAEQLETWIKNHVNKYKNIDQKKIYNQLFFREELRPIFRDENAFYSPADGVIIYQKKVKPNQKILEIKGKKYTLCDILMDKKIEDCYYYVIGIFMTLYDVHVNRIPTDGILKFKQLDSIESMNMPMIFMEKGIFSDDINYQKQNHQYLFNNERMVNTIIYNKKSIKYYVVQIADLDVDTITHFSTDNPDDFKQGDRFSFIRWGSQCDVIIPEHKKYNFEFCLNELMHVKAGEDKIIRIVNK